mmetsp:Transcript_55925/g.155958  ORF Transcript_55925/g.155958 Transcript_55925/m.155958 type:complete len:241 (-) Transcript_55925:219-941(-)
MSPSLTRAAVEMASSSAAGLSLNVASDHDKFERFCGPKIETRTRDSRAIASSRPSSLQSMVANAHAVIARSWPSNSWMQAPATDAIAPIAAESFHKSFAKAHAVEESVRAPNSRCAPVTPQETAAKSCPSRSLSRANADATFARLYGPNEPSRPPHASPPTALATAESKEEKRGSDGAARASWHLEIRWIAVARLMLSNSAPRSWCSKRISAERSSAQISRFNALVGGSCCRGLGAERPR